MTTSDVTIIDVHTLADLERAASVGPYQLVTGTGALHILASMSDLQAQACLPNCTYAHSFGPEGTRVEDLLDEFQVRLKFFRDDRFFPTVSDSRSEDLIWLILPESTVTPQLLAVSDQDNFGSEVASWFDRAKAELAEAEV